MVTRCFSLTGGVTGGASEGGAEPRYEQNRSEAQRDGEQGSSRGSNLSGECLYFSTVSVSTDSILSMDKSCLSSFWGQYLTCLLVGVCSSVSYFILC